MSAAKFLLEHFYYGQPVQYGRPSGQPQLLASSSGINPKMVEHAVGRVSLPPLLTSPNGSWALVRGKSRQMPFLLVQAQQGNVGQMLEHYIVATPDVLKSYGGNLQGLKVLVQDQLPSFEQVGSQIPPIEMPQGEPLSVDEQIDDILELMTITSNRTNLIEPLLAAIIQGTQLIVQAAPDSLDERIQFIEGLLALLPPSARFGVTFTTHSLPSTDVDVQIRFFSDGFPPDKTTVFNWGTKAVFGEQLQDDYSRFVISQLRLDAELVIQQNTKMTTIAGWRLNEDEKLSDALSYASKRLRLDEALAHGQPVDKDEVAKVLAEDPTLTDEMRVQYARHLINFSLAMEDMQHAEPVAILLHKYPELSRAVLQQMIEAMDEGQGWLIYDTLVNWISNPLGPTGREWVDLTHRAALSLLKDLVADNDIDEINVLLTDMQTASPGVDIGRIVPQVIQTLAGISQQDAHVAENLFILAVRYLDAKDFVALMNTEKFRARLAPEITRVWGAIVSEEMNTLLPGAILELARSFGDVLEPMMVVRFSELAAMANHYDLIDLPTLERLIRVIRSPERGLYVKRIVTVAHMMDESYLSALGQPGTRYILQIYLAAGEYLTLGKQMLKQSVTLYPGDLQTEYLKMIERLFGGTPVAPAEVPLVVRDIEQAGIKSVPLLVATMGLLHTQEEGSPEIDVIAASAARQLIEEPRYLDVMPPESILRLLGYYSRRKDTEGMALAAKMVPLAATYHGTNGIRMLAEMYKQMNWDEASRQVALQMLRTFIRQSDSEIVEKAIPYFGKELGTSIKTALEVTPVFHQFVDGVDILEYAHRTHAAAALLFVSARMYADGKQTLQPGGIVAMLDALPGGLSLQERRALAESISSFGSSIIQLGRQFRAGRARDENRHITQLLKGEGDPRSILDVLYVMSGYFSRGRRLTTDVTPPEENNPFAGYTAQTLMEDVLAADALFKAAQSVFPTNKPVKLTNNEVREETNSLVNSLTVEVDREVLRDLAIDLQRVPDLVALIEANGDARAFEEGSLAQRIEAGKHRPRSALEFWRFVAGYYASRA